MSDKKVVMHVSSTMNFGGAEVLMMNIIRKLHNDFHFIFLINQPKGKRIKGDFDDEILSLGAEIVYCDSIRSIGVSAYKKQLIKIFKDYNPDIVHCHLNSKCGIVSKCANKAGIKRIISHSHAQLKFRGNLIKSSLMYLELYWQRGMINKYSTDYWGCSNEALISLFNKRNRNSSRCKVVSNLIDAERFIYTNDNIVSKYKKTYNPNNLFTIGVVGRIAPVKNYLFAIDVIFELKKQFNDFIFLIVGLKQDKEYTERLFKEIEDKGLTNHVVYVEPKSDVENCYKMMNVVLGTSIREGFSLTAVEAQLSGAYTLLSNGYPKDVNLNAGNCVNVDDFNASIWANKIIEFINNPIAVSNDDRKNALINKGFDLSAEIDKIAKEYNKTT